MKEKKEEINNKLDDIKSDIENAIDREELLALKNKLDKLKNNEKNNKQDINALLKKVNGKLNKIIKKEERKKKII